LIREVGFAGTLPDNISVLGLKIPLSVSITGWKVKPTLMGLYGVTRCEGNPFPETDFGKGAVTLNARRGRHLLAFGARWTVAQTKEFDLQFGPRKVHFNPKTYVDSDFGLMYRWTVKEWEPGFWRFVELNLTAFDVNQTLRQNYRVATASAGFGDGWGLSASGTFQPKKPENSDKVRKVQDFVMEADKAFAWKQGKYFVDPGVGIDLITHSFCCYVGIKVGPLVFVPSYVTELGSESYQLVATTNPIRVWNMFTGKDEKSGGPGGGHGR
jgi:hypothetical protein